MKAFHFLIYFLFPNQELWNLCKFFLFSAATKNYYLFYNNVFKFDTVL